MTSDLQELRILAAFRDNEELSMHWQNALVRVFLVMKGLQEEGWSVEDRLSALDELLADCRQQFAATMKEPADG